jgi:hypothetical protein
MYSIKLGNVELDRFITLGEAMSYAKTVNAFVTIKHNDFEVVGRFGADSIKDGKCPDGIDYTWMKRRSQ